MRLSIIIPVSREEKYISILLDSLNQQNVDKSDFEVVVVKNHLDKINTSRFNIEIKILSCSSFHPSKRRNEGVRVAKGEVLGFLDDDTRVKSEWVRVVLDSILKEGYDIVTGPSTISHDNSFRQKVSNAIISSKFAMGKNSAGNFKKEKLKFWNILTCNCAMKRRVWDKIGGFNEVANYHVDDTEFFYIAERLDFKNMNIPNLSIAHKRRDFFIKFFQAQSQLTFYTGLNTAIFPEIYLRIPPIVLTLIAMGLLPIVMLINYKIILLLFLFYVCVNLVFTISQWKRGFKTCFLLFLCFFINHLVCCTSFTVGLIYSLINFKKYNYIRKYKLRRYIGFK